MNIKDKEQPGCGCRSKALFCRVLGTVVVVALVAALCWQLKVGLGYDQGASGSDARIEPVGQVNQLAGASAAVASTTTAAPASAVVAKPAVASAATPVVATTQPAVDGKAVFSGLCTGCHSAGVMGAPKFGNKTDWAPRIAKGKSTLYSHALGGFNNMPAKGGNASLSDDQVKAAVDYMVGAAK